MRAMAMPGTVLGVLLGLTMIRPAAAATTTPGIVQHLAHTPLGRLITVTLGRALVLKSELNLTESQREQMRGVLVSHRGEIAAVVQPLVEKHRAIRDAVLADKPDETAIRTAAADLAKAIGDAGVLRARWRGELTRILTPRQSELIEKFRLETQHSVDEFLNEVVPASQP